MAKGINKVFLLGNVGGPPEIKATPGGTTVASFSLATADRQKDQQGNWQHATEWHNIVALGRKAEIVRDYVKKGSQVHIEGKLRTRSWDDRASGRKKFRTEIIIAELTLLGSTQNSGGTEDRSPAQNGEETAVPDHARSTADGYEITDDDISF